MENESLWYITKKVITALKTKGVIYVVAGIRNRLYRTVCSRISVKNKKKFKFEKTKLNYCCSRYDNCWTTERAIEIPISIYLLDKYNAKNKRLLEIGNVLDNYTRKYKQVVVDKYEFSERVINEDIVSYKPNRKYPLAISISTLEHVGFDEVPKDPSKVVKGIKNIMKNCLTKKGQLIFTMPIGHNKYLEDMIKNNKIKIKKKYFFKRISLNNRWVETTEKDAFKKKYNFPYEGANAVMIGIIKNGNIR